MTTYVIKHSQCPACAKLGNDTSKDNLALYSDGGEHCFGCGYHVFPNKINAYLNRNVPEIQHSVVLPEDIEFSYPAHALSWIESFGITYNQLTLHKVCWSEQRQLLVFPYYINNQLKAWQGRYFGPSKHHPKWITYGKIHDFEYPLGRRTNTIILVEDIISAIKVSKCQQALPIFGSFISKQKLLTIRKSCDTIVIWLDPDKQKESITFANTASLYFKQASVILAEKDPKEYDYKTIGEIFDAKSIDHYS